MRSFLLLVLALPFTAWAGVTVSDDTGREVNLPAVPTRIISVSPGATEMLFAAGAGSSVIATVEYSDDPPAAKLVPRIGDGIAVDMERVVALRPDVVVVWPGGGNPAQIAKLESLGFPLYRHQVNVLADIPVALLRLGVLAGTQEAAARAAQDIELRLAALERRYRSDRPPAVLLQVWGQPIYTVGGKHLMSDSLRMCGVRNVFADLNDMGPAVDVEAIIARNPEMIIAVAPPESAQEWLNEWRRFKTLRAVSGGNLIPFSDLRLPRLGPSAVAATEALCKAIAARRGPG